MQRFILAFRDGDDEHTEIEDCDGLPTPCAERPTLSPSSPAGDQTFMSPWVSA